MHPKFKIPFIDLYTPQKRALLNSTLDRIKETAEQSQFILGDPVVEFEEEFAKLVGVNHAIGVNSGLDAILLSLRSLGISKGDEVVTVPNSFVATAAAISLTGARPVFVDVAEDFNLDPKKLEKHITKKTKAILPVHLTGNPCNMDEIKSIAEKYNLQVIEDAAQAVGASYDGKSVGSLGDLGAFSLHPLKNLHVWGDGGMITTNSDLLNENLKLQRNHGLKNRDEVAFFSYNSRLDSVQAIVGLQHLRLLKETTESRILNASIYDERLKGLDSYIQTPKQNPKARHVFHVYQVRCSNRDSLKSFLSEKGVETKIHYPIPIHWQEASSELGYKRGDFPVTDRLSQEILSLPVRENLKEAEIDYICDCIRSYYQAAKAA